MSPVALERLALAILASAFIVKGDEDRAVVRAQEVWDYILEFTHDAWADDNEGKV
jgi:hypothetical protein